jgi:hypothetical protein
MRLKRGFECRSQLLIWRGIGVLRIGVRMTKRCPDLMRGERQRRARSGRDGVSEADAESATRRSAPWCRTPASTSTFQ